jgi:hypothetical protein
LSTAVKKGAATRVTYVTSIQVGSYSYSAARCQIVTVDWPARALLRPTVREVHRFRWWRFGVFMIG